jgi:hypothetical protein
LLGWFSSRLIKFLVELQANYAEFNTGILKQLPWKMPSKNDVERMAEQAAKALVELRNLNAFSVDCWRSYPVILSKNC